MSEVYVVRLATGTFVGTKGGDAINARDLADASKYLDLRQAALTADAVGGGVCRLTVDKKGEPMLEPVDIGGDGSPMRFAGLDGSPPAPDAGDHLNANGYPKIYAPDPLPVEKPAVRRARRAAAIEKDVFGVPIHGKHDEQSDLISAEVDL